jgi:phytoene synthase
MELYTRICYDTAALFTKGYSTSFSASCRLLDSSIRHHIYAIYGLVRLADEIVDTYRQADSNALLNALESETYHAIVGGYSTNPIVHAFALTARSYSISPQLLQPFFASMRIDSKNQYTPANYAAYVHGSAEVVGLMCLRVFVNGNITQYQSLQDGACMLGSAYQKINFLRDMAADFSERGRVYFPDVTFQTFDNKQKARIEADITHELAIAETYITQLPNSCRKAVKLSYQYYHALFTRLAHSSAADVKTQRIRVPAITKILLFTRIALRPS